VDLISKVHYGQLLTLLKRCSNDRITHSLQSNEEYDSIPSCDTTLFDLDKHLSASVLALGDLVRDSSHGHKAVSSKDIQIGHIHRHLRELVRQVPGCSSADGGIARRSNVGTRWGWPAFFSLVTLDVEVVWERIWSGLETNGDKVTGPMPTVPLARICGFCTASIMALSSKTGSSRGVTVTAG
jgi:hypothetical protein